MAGGFTPQTPGLSLPIARLWRPEGGGAYLGQLVQGHTDIAKTVTVQAEAPAEYNKHLGRSMSRRVGLAHSRQHPRIGSATRLLTCMALTVTSGHFKGIQSPIQWMQPHILELHYATLFPRSQPFNAGTVIQWFWVRAEAATSITDNSSVCWYRHFAFRCRGLLTTGEDL